jgi:hypothetical protein
MEQWSVATEVGLAEAREPTAWMDDVYEALDALGAEAAVVAGSELTASVRLFVSARHPWEAMRRAERDLVLPALEKAGLRVERVLSGEATADDEFTRRLELPTLLELVGIAEVALMFGVSRQRASELANQRNFPPPVVKLAAGPVWTAPMIRAFAESWTRRPGRPRTRTA